MGNILSSAPTRERNAENVTSESETMNCDGVSHDMEKQEEHSLEQLEDEARTKAKEAEMDEFRRQLNIKREQRKEILARHRAEKEELEKSLQSERTSKMLLYESNIKLRELLLSNSIEIPENLQPSRETSELTDAVVHITKEFEIIKSHNNRLRRDLADANSTLQGAYSDIADLNSQNTESIKHINALKEVVAVSKTMINLREEQLNQLKSKLNEIERTLADRETNLLSADLKQEYERQLQNIRTLRGLYEERARLAEVARQGLVRELEEHKVLYQAEVNKCKDLTVKIEELETKVETLQDTIENKNVQISSCQGETNDLKAEMAVVNKLFSQVLLGYKTKQDLDKLVHRLEENHGLLTHMAERENGSEASSALPKLLLELVSEVDETEENKYADEITSYDNDTLEELGRTPAEVIETSNSQNTTVEEIVENLPKVWRVLTELLSHQSVADGNSSEKVTTCYKSVETEKGPVLVPSVSQTYIRLKDLIVEKLGLIKEVNRIKQLNTHLETRLEEQERRLCLVTTELSKTWHVVSRLRRHHHQLHTHEKILKYELQQKRKLLNELKEELEYCREKWEQAREKNTQSERDLRKLRAEFSSRKTKVDSLSLNNSAESGYSDERPSDESSESNDESEYVAESQVRCKKKLKKSFETIFDSSTDFNPAAEREDPASDMLDVADLPLDTQEGDDNQISDVSRSDNIHKSEKVCEETEDELCDITHDDLCIGESTAADTCDADISKNGKYFSLEATNTGTVESTDNIPLDTSSDIPGNIRTINPAETLKNVRQQNERLDKNYEKLENLEITTAALLNKTQATTMSISTQAENANESLENKENEVVTVTESPSQCQNVVDVPDFDQKNASTVEVSNSLEQNNSIISGTDFKAILESIKQQNARLTSKDERLLKLESGCSDVVKNINSTLKTGEEISNKLDTLHKNHENSDKTNNINMSENNIDKDCSSTCGRLSEPSTSNNTDHEARFAARDLRLKSLEEQTKSLVNKMNKTTTKGVKINYKLEELHNIYGSENSRAGTPSEDDDKNKEEEMNNE